MAINKILYNKIVEMAGRGETVTYEPVMKLVGLKLGNYGAAEIGRMLEEICKADYRKNRPLSGAIVVSKNSGIPSPGFFNLAKSLGRQTNETDADFFQSERQKVFEYWQENKIKNRKPQHWLEVYWPERGERDFLAVWFHNKKKYKPQEFHIGDKVLFYEIIGENPDGYSGAGTLFASGVLTKDELEEVPERFQNYGGKEWQRIWRVFPEIQVSPEKGVPFHDILRQLPQFRGWVRQGTKLSKRNFDLLESLLQEQQEFGKELTYREGAEARFVQTIRERNQKLKKAAIRKYGNKCMVCNFDFDKFYGKDIANGYIEIHHEQMLSQSLGERETSLDQIKVVCSNCHRMIHRTKSMLDWKELKNKINPFVYD